MNIVYDIAIFLSSCHKIVLYQINIQVAGGHVYFR